MATTDQKDKIRRWISDYADTNILDQVQEVSDTYLDDCFNDALDEVNYEINPRVTTIYTTDTVPFGILKYGVLKNILLGMGIWSARNRVSYSDTGGVNVKSFDKWETYMPWFDRLERTWETKVGRFKQQQNLDDGWGEVPSEYSLEG